MLDLCACCAVLQVRMQATTTDAKPAPFHSPAEEWAKGGWAPLSLEEELSACVTLHMLNIGKCLSGQHGRQVP